MKYNDAEILLRSLRRNQMAVPSEHFRKNARIRILNNIDVSAGPINATRPSFATRIVRWSLSFITALGLAGTGVVFAAQQSEPGTGLYPVKVASEQVAIILAPTKKVKTSIMTAVIDRRVKEIEHTQEQHNDDETEHAIRSYEKTIRDATESSKVSREDVDERISSHEKFIEEVKQRKEKSKKVEREDDMSIQEERTQEIENDQSDVNSVEVHVSETPEKQIDLIPSVSPTPVTILEDSIGTSRDSL